MRFFTHTLLRLATRTGSQATGSDAELLARFTHDRDDSAFAAIIDRHGSMVLGVARRILRDSHAAEDVFQATFLALARNANAVRRPGGLPAWLHKTAVRAAVKVARSHRAIPLDSDPPAASSDPLDTLTARELLAVIDEEVQRLPSPFRAAVVACALEGLSQDEAARLLGWSPGQVRGRLERGRRRLEERLARRGFALAVGWVLLLLASAPVVNAQLREACVSMASGRAVATPAVAALAATAGRTLPFRAAIILVLGLAAVGLAGLTVKPLHTAAPIPRAEIANTEVGLPEGAIRRFGSARYRAANGPIAMTPDGRSLVTLSPEGMVRFIEPETGRITTEYLLPMSARASNPDQRAILSADGSAAVTGVTNADATGNTLTAWDLKLRRQIWTAAKHGGMCYDVALSANGQRLVVVEHSANWQNSVVRAIDFSNGQSWVVAELPKNVRKVKLSPDGKQVILTIGLDDALAGQCFNADTGEKLWDTPRLGYSAEFSSDGALLFTMVDRYRMLAINPKTGKSADGVKLPEQVFNSEIPPVSSPDGRTVIVGDLKSRGLILWDYQTGKELGVIPAYPSYSMYSGYRFRQAMFSRDGKVVFTTIDRIRRWDATTGKALDSRDPADGHGQDAIGVRFSADGREVYSLGKDRRYARWSADGRLLESGDVKADSSTIAGTEAVFRTGSKSMVFERFPVLRIIPEEAPKPGPVFEWGRRNPALLTVPTADGRTTISLSDDSLGEKRSLDVSRFSPNVAETLPSFKLPFTRAVPPRPVSPCGRWIVLDGKVYSTSTGKELLAPEAPGIGGRPARLATDPSHLERVWFSPDGRFLAGTLAWQEATPPGQRLVAVWELASGKVLAKVPVHYDHDAALSPGGRTLVDGGIQGITVRDLFAGTSLHLQRRDLSTGWDFPQSQPIGFAPSGRTFVTGHADGSVFEWAIPHAAKVRAIPEADTAWADLNSSELWKARAAVERLVDHPEAADKILAAKFSPPTDQEVDEKGKHSEIPVSGEILRGLRAIEVLERTGTPAARKLLAGWRDQVRHPRLAVEAAFVLERLGPAER